MRGGMRKGLERMIVEEKQYATHCPIHREKHKVHFAG